MSAIRLRDVEGLMVDCACLCPTKDCFEEQGDRQIEVVISKEELSLAIWKLNLGKLMTMKDCNDIADAIIAQKDTILRVQYHKEQ